MQSETAITSLIAKSSAGDADAASNLFLLAYDELRGLARGYLRRERYAQSIEATGLVHEAYMRLVPNASPEWKDRGHFIAIAARATTERRLATADEIDDLDLVAVLDHRGVVGGLLDDVEIELDGDAPRINLQPREERADAERPGDLVRIAVERDRHCRRLRIVPQSARARAWVDRI